MSAARCNRDEIYRYAEQVLLGDLQVDDLKQRLHKDDIAKVKTVVKRGPAALAEVRGEKVVDKTKLRRLMQRKGQKGKAVYIPLTSERPDFIALIQHIPFRPFPTQLVMKETKIFRTALMTSLTRRMKMRDLAIFLNTLDPQQQDKLLSCSSEAVQNELKGQLEKLQDEEGELHTEVPLAQYSLVTTQFMRQQDYLAPSIREGLQQYILDIEQDIIEYCRQMPQRMGTLQDIQHFTDHQWRRLAGLTPREDMAQLHAILDEATFKKLTGPLPERQHKELSEQIDFWERSRRQDIERLGSLVSCVKQWAGIIQKVKQS